VAWREEGFNFDAFLQFDLLFRQGNLILVAFVTKKIKTYYIGVIVSVFKREQVVKFISRVKNISVFI
jgi:hypothetical protein